MRKLLLICLSCLALVANAAGQQQTNYTSADEIQRDLTFLLLDKNINEVTRQLESEGSSTVGRSSNWGRRQTGTVPIVMIWYR